VAEALIRLGVDHQQRERILGGDQDLGGGGAAPCLVLSWPAVSPLRIVSRSGQPIAAIGARRFMGRLALA
jgi:hypothetical protein